MKSKYILSHSALPFRIQACVVDHGKTTVIVDSEGFVVAKVPSAVWRKKAVLAYPQDRGNAALILQAVNTFYPMKAALLRLRKLIILERLSVRQNNPDARWEYAEESAAALDEASRLLSSAIKWQ
jgi:hypothetical protein